MSGCKATPAAPAARHGCHTRAKAIRMGRRVRYDNTTLHGLLIVDKPLGVTSMDVCRVVRRRAGNCKTGHAGTLDPLATGVLIVCLGNATKAVDQLMGQTKVYETTVDLSAFTNTDDAEGEREPVDIAAPPSEADVRAALDDLTGDIQQAPPLYSAIKVNGQRAYKLARQGSDIELPKRPVRIDRIDLLRYDWPMLDLRITCGKGTYIRSLARQIGEALGTGGYLTALRRTAIGEYTIDMATPLDDIAEPITDNDVVPTPGTKNPSPPSGGEAG
ncbi:MAG: tRNA pseudouridine(55) synthase TruB [Phycisphaera sp.]|nr:tRNA pseudouridine(55) synthase TruB [Phycisphaera sp.]